MEITVRRMLDEFDVEEAVLRTDVERLLSELVAAGLLRPTHPSAAVT